jgi:hypothetical protein
MEVLSYFILVFFSTFIYCCGAITKSGKSKELKPKLIDIAIVVCIWVAAILSKIYSNIDKWLLILIWLVISFALGFMITWLRKPELKEIQKSPTSPTKNPLKIFWQGWLTVTKRIGGFQSRLILAMIYFIAIAPIALFNKKTDYQKLKNQNVKTYWQPVENPEKDSEKT